MRKHIAEQHRFLLAIISSPFTATQDDLSAYDKKTYAVQQTLRRMNYLLASSNGVTGFTNHHIYCSRSTQRNSNHLFVTKAF